MQCTRNAIILETMFRIADNVTKPRCSVITGICEKVYHRTFLFHASLDAC